MSDTKHTPGPWSVIAPKRAGGELGSMADVGILGANGAIIAEAWLECPLPAHEKYIAPSEANARLIAAAPDLLDALEEIAAPACMAMNSADRVEAFRDLARAAIAKAKGE